MREAMVKVLGLVAQYESMLPCQFVAAAMDLGMAVNRYLLESPPHLPLPPFESRTSDVPAKGVLIAAPALSMSKPAARGSSPRDEAVPAPVGEEILALERPAQTRSPGDSVKFFDTRQLELFIEQQRSCIAAASEWTAQVLTRIQQREGEVRRLRSVLRSPSCG